jgi:hypothetical protein
MMGEDGRTGRDLKTLMPTQHAVKHSRNFFFLKPIFQKRLSSSLYPLEYIKTLKWDPWMAFVHELLFSLRVPMNFGKC